jgi:hypothetical protein
MPINRRNSTTLHNSRYLSAIRIAVRSRKWFRMPNYRWEDLAALETAARNKDQPDTSKAAKKKAKQAAAGVTS